MNLIVLDLEWNQCPDGKARSDPRLPFEIIEVGAVKLGEDLSVLDTFHEIITPRVYRHLHYRTRSVISLHERDLKGHRSFPDVIRSFFDWCGQTYGSDYMICTWGPADLPELQRNMDYYKPSLSDLQPFPFPLFYVDAQKVYGLTQEGSGKTSRSLEYAVDSLGIPKDEPFHGAYSDALYTARVVAALPAEELSTWYSMDYYRLPRKKSEEVYLHFPTYTKYVSRPFENRDRLLEDKEAVSSVCCECGRKCRRKIRWFSSGQRTMLSLAWCPDHGYLQGKMRLRTNRDGSVYIIKTQKLVNSAQAQVLRDKKNAAAARSRKRAALQRQS